MRTALLLLLLAPTLAAAQFIGPPASARMARLRLVPAPLPGCTIEGDIRRDSVTGAAFECRSGEWYRLWSEVDGIPVRADGDVYGNTFIAQAIGETGTAGIFGFICNQSPCTWKLGAGSQEEVTASGNILTVNFGQVSLPTTEVLQMGNKVNSTMRWFVPTVGHFFGLFPTTDVTGCASDKAGGLRYLSTINAVAVCNGTALQRLAVDTPTTLPTCAAALEGLSLVDAASGGTSGSRTRRCLCTSDGGGTPAYAWQNLATATVGTTTTCSP